MARLVRPAVHRFCETLTPTLPPFVSVSPETVSGIL